MECRGLKRKSRSRVGIHFSRSDLRAERVRSDLYQSGPDSIHRYRNDGVAMGDEIPERVTTNANRKEKSKNKKTVGNKSKKTENKKKREEKKGKIASVHVTKLLLLSILSVAGCYVRVVYVCGVCPCVVSVCLMRDLHLPVQLACSLCEISWIEVTAICDGNRVRLQER